LLALRYKRDAFSPELFRLLKQEQRDNRYDVVLDFDPIVGGGQDFPNRCFAGKVIPRNARYLVEVWWDSAPPAQSEKTGEKPTVTPELVFRDGHWIFVNFHYEDGSDLMGVLKELRIERRKGVN
jgi:hypothetical protein